MYEYMYRMPGWVYAEGPMKADNIADARRRLRKMHNLKRLPKNTEVWRYTRWY